MTYRELLREAAKRLSDCQVEEAELNAWLLLEYCTGMNKAQYFLRQQEEASRDLEKRYGELLKKRERHIPLQYLTGRQVFMGLEFLVNESVLIPRMDTEILVEEALKKLLPGQRVLDMCTGSGCIIISIVKFMENGKGGLKKAVGADLSEEALKVAEVNAGRLQAEVEFRKSDLFSQVEEVYDCIVSNPPYIPTGEIAGLMPEVRDYEPAAALDGKEDGLYFYRELVRQAWGHLKMGGWLLFEIGYDQGEAVSQMMVREGYEKIEIKKDLAGLPRVVLGKRR